MPSLRAQAVNYYLRRKMKPLPLADMDPVKIREVMDRTTLPFQPKGVVREIVSDPVQGEWHQLRRADGAIIENGRPGAGPNAQTRNQMVLYFHGGGYVFGSPRSHQSLTFTLATKTKAPVFSAVYRLAPENPCPAAIDDALAVYDWLLANGRAPGDIVIGGDSAGGGLAVALLQALKTRGDAQPAGAFLYSPWVDLKDGGAAMRENEATDAMFQADHIQRGALRYAGTLALDDPRVSPVYGDLAGLPPLLIFVSESELLRDSSTMLVEKARAAGVDATVISEAGLTHVWPIFTPLMPEAKTAVTRTVSFIKERWG